MKLLNIVGARPNFIKIAPIIHELQLQTKIQHALIHTGQHYDVVMSQQFFDELNIPKPNISLEAGSDTHAKQVAKIMHAFDEVCDTEKPDAILVVGDVNSTMACSLVASKRDIKVIHVEAGIRSFDRTMPEEINRLVTDSITDLFLPPSQDAVDNLLHEGIPAHKIELVGNIMIDTLMQNQSEIQANSILNDLKLGSKKYSVVTLHRPSNVDTQESLTEIVHALVSASKLSPIVFPVHLRTIKKLAEFNLLDLLKAESRILLTEPLGYFAFGKLVSNAQFVITDSGGIQEETTVYKIPCITLRENTERPITVSVGSNKLVKTKTQDILENIQLIHSGSWKHSEIPPLWEGKTASRIVQAIQKRF